MLPRVGDPSGAICMLGLYAGLIGGAFLMGHSVQKSRGEQLRRLARKLEGGRARVPQGWFSSISNGSVTGALQGLKVSLTFQVRGSGKHKRTVAVYKVQLTDGVGSVTVRRADLLTRFARWLGMGQGAVTGNEHLDRRFTFRGDQAALRQLQRGQKGQDAEVTRGLERAFNRHGLDQIELRRAEIRAEHDAVWSANHFEDVLSSLVGLARSWGRRPIEVKVRGAVSASPHMAWTGGGTQPLCPFCRSDLGEEDAELAACPRCDTVHHAECLEEAGGCTVFGCGGRRTERVAQRA